MRVVDIEPDQVIVEPRQERPLGDLDGLIASIQTVGLLHPIVVGTDHKLKVGYRRLMAYRTMGRDTIPAHLTDNLNDIVQALKAERDENVQRENLPPTVMVERARELEEQERAEAEQRMIAGRQPCDNLSQGKTRDKVGDAFGVSGSTYEHAKAVVEAAKADPETFGDLPEAMDEKSVNSAYKTMIERKKHKERQDQRTAPGNYQKDEAKIIIGDARDMDLSAFSDAPFGVIIADPPWPYRVERGEGIASDQYTTMSDADLRTMPIAEIAKPDCVLFLWGTWPKLPEALQLMSAWGFDYVTGFPWVKTTTNNLKDTPVEEITLSYGVGYWVRGCSECILVGRRGKVSAPRLEGFLGIVSPNFQHSRKPDDVHTIALSLPGPHLELFARRSHAGFTVFGNEIQGTFS